MHRDIKPGNLLITPAGQLKVTDFGIAKVAHQVPVTRTGMVMGTAQYISPEQASGREAVPASDVYSLGVVAYECLAGRLPFPNENAVAMALAHVRETPRPLPPDVPPAIATLVMRMLAKDPAARYPDGGSLAREVAALRAPSGHRTGPPRSVTAPRSATAPRSTTAPRSVAAPRSGPSPRPPAGRPSSPPLAQRAPVAQTRQPRPTRVQPIQQPAPVPAGARSVVTATPPRPASPPQQLTVVRSTGRRTGLSVLLALLVLLAAAVLLLVLHEVFGALPGSAGTVLAGQLDRPPAMGPG